MYNNIGVQMYLLPVEENIKYINTSIIPSVQQDKLGNYKNPFDRNKRLLARSFLYEFLQHYYAISDFELEMNPYQKPVFKTNREIHFSFSYSKDYLIVAIFSSKIGVDIEYIDPELNVFELASQIMSDNELERFQSFTDHCHKRTFFFKLFSIKESIVKAFGTGLNYDPRLINTIDQLLFFYQEKKFKQEVLNVIDDYMVSVCYEL